MNSDNWRNINKHWVAFALALAAGYIAGNGHDGWGWCLIAIVIIEAD